MQACEYLLSECEANPLNFEIYMYFVQSVANLSRNVDPFGEYKKGILNMKLYTKEDGDRRVKELEESIVNL